MTDMLQRKMDADTRKGTFEVDPNHPAFGASYCPMCGGEVGRDKECLEKPCEHANEAVKLVGDLCRMIATGANRKMGICVAIKIDRPWLTVRDIADTYGISRSEVNVSLKNAAQKYPQLRRILGFDSPRSNSQTERRRRECR